MCSPGWSASGTLGSRSHSKPSPSPRARGEGRGEGCGCEPRNENKIPVSPFCSADEYSRTVIIKPEVWLQTLKPLRWVASSKKDLLEFPDAVRREIGYALYFAQAGDKHPSAKP
jgi:hypothetical protein